MVLLVVAGSFSAGALIQSKSGKVERFAAVDADHGEFTCTVGGTPVLMPGMSVTFSPDSGRVLVLFQGEWRPPAPPTGDAKIQLRIDGVVQSGPGSANDLIVNTSTEDSYTNGFNFISNSLTEATHTAQIFWSAAATTDKVCVEERSMIVLFED